MCAEQIGMTQKVVLRKRDGSMVKCSTYSHFSAAYAFIKVVTTEGKVETVPLSELKAIFFVRDFAGNPSYEVAKEFGDGSPRAEETVRVTFEDGEVLTGKVLNLAEHRQGFFLFPMDPNENNRKIFVVRSPETVIEAEK